MSEIRSVYQIPIHILQEFITVLRTNLKFTGEGQIGDYYLIKDDKFATILYDNDKVSFIANLVKDNEDNWFFIDKVAIRDSLKGYIEEKI